MKVLAPSLLLLLFCFSAAAQAPDLAAGNSLEELRDKRNVLLVVFKSRVIDVSDREGAIIDDALHPDRHPKGTRRWDYTQLSKKLNKYTRKNQNLSAASELSEDDYVIFFNVVEFRRI